MGSVQTTMRHKDIYTLTKPKTKITTRKWRKEDIPQIIECSRATYPDGDTIYGSDIAVHLDFQRRGVATVRPLHDMRSDLYELSPKNKIEIISVE